jgi:hypothetical protein
MALRIPHDCSQCCCLHVGRHESRAQGCMLQQARQRRSYIPEKLPLLESFQHQKLLRDSEWVQLARSHHEALVVPYPLETTEQTIGSLYEPASSSILDGILGQFAISYLYQVHQCVWVLSGKPCSMTGYVG